MNERITPLAAAIFAVLYPASAALAQETAPPASGTRLESVTVTATRRDEKLQDVGQSITAISTEAIEKHALQNLSDAIGALPSVNIVSGVPGRNAVVMRGVSTGSEEFRTDSQVAVYLDDQPMTTISTQVDVRLIDIARIESLPGPQGTLFGSSSQTGTIRYITNKPEPNGYSGELDAEVGTTKGGDPSYDVSGHVNIPVTDNLAIRAVGYYSLEGGYVDNVLGVTLADPTRDNSDVVQDNWNDYTTAGGRVAARWTINPQWEASLSFIMQTSVANGSWETDPALGKNKITRFFDEYRDDDWYQASMNIKGDLGFAELSVTTSYFDRKIVYEWDNMTYDQWRSQYYSGPIYNTDLTFGTTYNNQKQRRWAYEVRLTSQGESRFQWLAGAFYEDVYDWWDYGADNPSLTSTTAWGAAQYYACAAAYAGYNVACPLPDTTLYYQNIYDKTIKQKAIFGELTYSLTDRWSITGGARWFEYDRREFDIYGVPKGLPPYPIDSTLGRLERAGISSDHVIKLGTEFHIDDDRMLYFLYSEGFRLGGTNSQRAAQTGLIPQEYGPDTLKNYELGLKSQWLDNKLQLNVSLFLMKWDKIQLNDNVPRSAGGGFWVRGTFNGGKAEQKGIELNASWNLTDRLSLEASVFAADPQFTEATVYPDGTIIEAGLVMPVSPDRKYWLAAEYKFPRFLPWNGDFSMRWSYSYQSETWDSISAILANDRERLLPPYSTSTLQFAFNHANGWDATLIVRNLFDEAGYNYLLADSGYEPLFGDPRYKNLRSLQRPVSISLSFSKKW